MTHSADISRKAVQSKAVAHMALRDALDAAEASERQAVERKQKLARRIHMQRAQLRWLNAWMSGDLQHTRMYMLKKTMLSKRVCTPFGPDPSALRAAWEVVLRRVHGSAAIRARGLK